MRKVFLLFLAGIGLFASLALSSCNTTRGFGQDLQKLGSEIEQGSNEVYRGY